MHDFGALQARDRWDRFTQSEMSRVEHTWSMDSEFVQCLRAKSSAFGVLSFFGKLPSQHAKRAEFEVADRLDDVRHCQVCFTSQGSLPKMCVAEFFW